MDKYDEMKKTFDDAIAELGDEADKPVTFRDLFSVQFEMCKMVNETSIKGEEIVYDTVQKWLDDIIDAKWRDFYFIMGILYGNRTEAWKSAYDKYCKDWEERKIKE